MLTMTFTEYDDLLERVSKKNVFEPKCPDKDILDSVDTTRLSASLPMLMYYAEQYEPMPDEMQRHKELASAIQDFLYEHLTLVDEEDLESDDVVVIKESEYRDMIRTCRSIFENTRNMSTSRSTHLFHTMDDIPRVSDFYAHQVEDIDMFRKMLRYIIFYAEVYEPVTPNKDFDKTRKYLRDLIRSKLYVVPDKEIQVPRKMKPKGE